MAASFVNEAVAFDAFLTPLAVALEPFLTPLAVALEPFLTPLAVALEPFLTPLAVAFEPFLTPLAVAFEPFLTPLAVALEPFLTPLAVALEPFLAPLAVAFPTFPKADPVVRTAPPMNAFTKTNENVINAAKIMKNTGFFILLFLSALDSDIQIRKVNYVFNQCSSRENLVDVFPFQFRIVFRQYDAAVNYKGVFESISPEQIFLTML